MNIPLVCYAENDIGMRSRSFLMIYRQQNEQSAGRGRYGKK